MIASLFILIAMFFLLLAIIAFMFELLNHYIEKNKKIKWKKSLVYFIIYVFFLVIGLIIFNA